MPVSIQVNVDPDRAAEFRHDGHWGDASLHDYWHLSRLAFPEKLAVKDRRGTALTYRELDVLAARCATYLRGRGVGAGDVVSVQLPNWAEFVIVDVACLKLGAVVNPVLADYRWTELHHILTVGGSRALILPLAFRSHDYGELARRVLADPEAPPVVLGVGDGANPAGLPTLAEVLEATEPLPAADWTPGRGTDVAAVLFTSGTESAPKGVLLSHDNVIFAERTYAELLGIGPSDRVFTSGPVGHATGYQHGVTLAFMTGATCVLLDVVNGDTTLKTINDEGCTCGQAAARVISCLFDACASPQALSPTLRFLCCGGSPVPRRLRERARHHGIRLYGVYGSTESTPHAMTSPDDSDEQVLTTDGRAVPGVRIRIVDPETRRPVPPGLEGEEASRGPQVFLGYLGAPELTARAVDADGWYFSGDLAVMDADGHLRITGRRKDVIIRAGENISALEVESVIREYPGVDDVAVVGVPDERTGERACAYLVMDDDAPAPTLADLRTFFAERGVATFKIPERLEFVEDLPLTTAGKVNRKELRERAGP